MFLSISHRFFSDKSSIPRSSGVLLILETQGTVLIVQLRHTAHHPPLVVPGGVLVQGLVSGNVHVAEGAGVAG